MNTINYGPLNRVAVGFEGIFREMEKLHLNHQTSIYPPYNIITIDEDRFQIELAVAGFSEENLNITVENYILTVSGNKGEEEDTRTFIHRGIAMRNFTRPFRLAAHIEVESAKIENGLLVITLQRKIPEELRSKKIAISRD